MNWERTVAAAVTTAICQGLYDEARQVGGKQGRQERASVDRGMPESLMPWLWLVLHIAFGRKPHRSSKKQQ